MVEFHHCAYITSYIRDIIDKLNNECGYNNNDLIKNISSFIIEDISTPHPQNKKPSEKERQLVYTLQNILSRGFPTFCSISLERELSKAVKQKVNIEETNVNGSIFFIDDIKENSAKLRWYNSLIDSLLLYDSEFEPDVVFNEIQKEHNSFSSESVSNEEKVFYCRLLPQILGYRITELFQPQRALETMLPSNMAKNYLGQKVDFALEVIDCKFVVEIDGSQHFNDPMQHSLDSQRRNELKNNGWQIIEITASEVKNGLKPENENLLRLVIENSKYLTRLFNLDKNNASSELLTQTPLIAARLHCSILSAMKNGYLSLNDKVWNICIIEDSVKFSHYAIQDFEEWLKNFCLLFKMAIPKIRCRVIKSLEDYIPVTDEEIIFYLSLKKKWVFNERKRIQDLPNSGKFLVYSCFYDEENFKINSTLPFAYEINDNAEAALLFLLQTIFRKENFREGQLEILRRTLGLKPVIGLLPTGAGKSLTYQLSALMQAGVTLVVDPLRSLMFDQADNLSNYLIGNIQFINSEQTAAERQSVINEMSNGRFLLMFISPERFQDENFRKSLIQLTVSFPIPYLVIDEAHCISEWGHDFRTSYLNLAKSARKFCRYKNHQPIVLALTGTASHAVLSDVQREINIDDEKSQISPKTFARPELKMDLHETASANKFDILLGLLNNQLPQSFGINSIQLFRPDGANTKSGIVFVPWTNNIYGSDVRDLLQKRLNITIGFFSGSVPKFFQPNETQREINWNKEKRKVQSDYKNNKISLLVSTKAFGMGIDKPNIRYTIHYGIPPSLEAFYQEAGRAGRDKDTSYCVIIFSDDNSDIASKYLDVNLSAKDLREMKEQRQWPQFGQEGDIHRMLYFHMNSFQGDDKEILYLNQLLINSIYPEYNKLQIGQSHQILIPIADNLDKAIYRLSILGIIEDYTIDWNSKQYSVILNKLTDVEIVENLESYLSRYKTPDYIKNLIQQVKNARGANIIEKCLGAVVRFAYNEIEKKRRAALKTMWEVAKNASKLSANIRATYINEQILSYLEKSIFTDLLLTMAQSDSHNYWWKILDMVTDIDTARQLLGGCRRTIESFPEHPGLYILSSFARLALSGKNKEEFRSDFTTGLRLLVRNYNIESQEVIILTALKHYEKMAGELDSDTSAIILNMIQTRVIALFLYPVQPKQCLNILLNNLLIEIQKFNKQYLRDYYG